MELQREKCSLERRVVYVVARAFYIRVILQLLFHTRLRLCAHNLRHSYVLSFSSGGEGVVLAAPFRTCACVEHIVAHTTEELGN